MPFGQVLAIAAMTFRRMRYPLLTIALMLSLGYVTRYGGTDATLGLAFTKTGWLYPFFAAYLGWLGVALTGSDTSSNVLFGSLQKITAQQLGLNPILITTANSTGGVMGKMIDAQSIVVATASTGQHGSEGKILRFVFWHSVALAAIMGLIVMLQAYVFPWMIPSAKSVRETASERASEPRERSAPASGARERAGVRGAEPLGKTRYLARRGVPVQTRSKRRRRAARERSR